MIDPAPATVPGRNEDARLRMLALYDPVASGTPGAFDDISGFASRLCETPVALVTVLDAETQHALATTGVELPTLPRPISFCHHAVGGDTLVEIRDLSLDPRTATNPIVTGDHHARFYAGMPMVTSDGSTLGTVCVVDRVARPDGLTQLQREGLAILAKLAMTRLDARREAGAGTLTARALVDSEARFHTLADAMPQMVWSTLPDGFHDYYNARWYDFTGAPAGSTDGEGWNDMFHPDDQERAWGIWRHSLQTGDPYQIEYRLKHFDGTYRWVLGRALPIRDPATGTITRWFGTCTDVHEQKLASEEREVISQELSHRIKNIFAVIAGLITVAARARPEFRPIAEDLRERITALGRAHDFVRPHSAASRPAARQDSLHGMLADLFAAYGEDGADRIVVTGDDIAIDDRAATPLALLFHELATNATKYGALAVEGGQVVLAVERRDDRSRLTWRERGGPATAEPHHKGFGSQLIELSAVRQLGGKITRDWGEDGLTLVLELPTAALSRYPTGPA